MGIDAPSISHELVLFLDFEFTPFRIYFLILDVVSRTRTLARRGAVFGAQFSHGH